MRPPALAGDDPRFPGRERRYAGLGDAELPRTERPRDSVKRVLHRHCCLREEGDRGR
ncbi:MAG TPA: hypothetical protein VFG47_00620 [Geminicoccaceae bacterium]|nr:hypothetical protein [Geminicoccaceae bacterium]